MALTAPPATVGVKCPVCPEKVQVDVVGHTRIAEGMEIRVDPARLNEHLRRHWN